MYLAQLLSFILALSLSSSVSTAASLAGTNSTIYLIRHAEKSEDGLSLSDLGMRRAECIADIFSNPALGITYLLVPTPMSDGKSTSSLYTVSPLADRLGMIVDTACGRNNVGCVAGKAEKWGRQGRGNVLITWRHGRIANVSESLGVEAGQVVCPEDAYDLIWTIRSGKLASVATEMCPDIDEKPADESGYYIRNRGGEHALVVQG